MSETEESSDQKTRRYAGIVGAAIFGAASVMELVRISTKSFRWTGFNIGVEWLLSVIAIVLWVGSAYALAVHRREYIIVAVCGAFALLNHGLLGTTGGSSFGVVYVVLGGVMVILERLAFGGKLTLGTRWTPTRPVAGPQIV